MGFFQFFLGLLLLWTTDNSVAAFVGSGLSPPLRVAASAKENALFSAALLPRSEDGTHSTSLHVGVAYGPPMVLDDAQRNVLQRRTTTRQKYNPTNELFFDVDPAFSAVSIAYPANTETTQEAQRLKRVKKALAGSIAVVCSALLAQRMPALLAQLPYFFKAYPLKASIATCAFNSVMADTISQVQSKNKGDSVSNLEWRQSFSSITYGALILGIGSNLVYTKLLPALFPGNGARAILSQACVDNFVCAPLVWLPPAYMIKAAFLRQPVLEALKTYVQAVRKEKLLVRYWSMWLPAQTFTFSVVPKHLRVLCTAAFSFVWFLILTKMTSKKTASA